MNTFNAAFAAILGSGGADDTDARAKIADAQRREFGLKEWTPDAPTRDALNQKMVFKDARGYTYTVSHAREDGSHVRTYYDSTQPVQTVDLEARARSFEEADRMMDLALAERTETERHPVGGAKILESGFYTTRYRVGRPSLD